MRHKMEIFRMESNKVVLMLLCLSFAITLSVVITPNQGWASLENKTLMQQQGTQSMTANTTNMNIILVHGGWADGSSWGKVITILKNSGHKVIAVNLPLHNLAMM